jgi:hypothetical protein
VLNKIKELIQIRNQAHNLTDKTPEEAFSRKKPNGTLGFSGALHIHMSLLR